MLDHHIVQPVQRLLPKLVLQVEHILHLQEYLLMLQQEHQFSH